MKKIISLIIALLMIIQSVPVLAITDEFIFTDPIRDEFSGRADGMALITNLNFADMTDHWAGEAVTRAGALNIIKGYDAFYYPWGAVSNVEMLASVLRIMGRENDATVAAARLSPTLPQGSDLRTETKIGYLSIANQLRFITAGQYANVLAADQTALDPAANFIYDAPVSRQQAAAWLVTGLLAMNANAFDSVRTNEVQNTYNYSDWDEISAVNLASVELMLASGVMEGDENGMFRPNDALSRAELAQMIRNLDTIYYDLVNIQKRSGTVGGIAVASQATTGSGDMGMRIYVRTSLGDIDVLQNFIAASNSGPIKMYEAPTYAYGEVGGLYLLEEGDEIEYLVRTQTEEVLYVEVVGGAPTVVDYVTGKLQSINHTTGKITIKLDDGSAFTSTMMAGLYYTENDKNYVYVDYKKQESANLPIGSTVKLRLKNSICDEIYYIGEPNVVDEFRGIVIENNTDLGYMVVIDNQGKRIIKNFYSSDIKVKKKEYYDADDEIGYISEIFPYFKYNPMDTDIFAIEPGDIVFIRNDPDNPDYIQSISASTNYVAKYGKILQFNYNGEYYEMLLEYENKQTTWFDVSEQLFITRSGKPVTAETVVPGDWVRVLVNQAIISPGYVIESAKELVLEGMGHMISTVMRGQLAGINSVQNQLLVQNVQTLTKNGWSNYKQADNFNISGRDIEYYYDGKQISLEYALKYFKRSDNEVYVALESNYAGEKVRKVTFRSGRDQILNPDTVISSDGNGSFSILGNSGQINTDAGTIVRRYGRLVSGNNIMIPDYAVVSLNGWNTAAVVDIVDAPDNSQIILARGRVISVDEGKSFKVQSMAVLSGNDWLYTPIAREFAIDYNTVFVTADGVTTLDKFVDYNSAVDDETLTAVDKVYTVLIDGSRAAWIIESPYPTRSVRGTVYAVDQAENVVHLKDASYLNNQTGVWSPVSNTNATLTINVHPNTFITKINKAVGLNSITVGDQIKVMSDTLPDKVTPGTEVDAYIIFAEK